MDLEKVKDAMKQQKISQKDLSIKSKVPLQTIKYILTGRTPNPRIDTIQAIEKALGLDNTGINIIQNNTLSDKENRLLTAFNSLIPPMQDYILEMVEKLTEQGQNVKGGAV